MTAVFFILWLILNGRITLEIVLFGAGLSALLYGFMIAFMGWSWRRELHFLRAVPFMAMYVPVLLWEIAKAAVTVLLVALNPSQHPEPALCEFHSGLPGEYRNVILANSITLTPGTITVFQEQDHFVIHALRKEYTQGLENSSFVRLLRKFP